MNLHGLVTSVIGVVNPQLTLQVQVSNGYVTNADGTRVASFLPAVSVPGQVQALTYMDIRRTDGLALEGERRAIYINGKVDGLVRAENHGGDLITLPDASVWLVAQVLEYWPDWCKVVATLQSMPFTPETGVQPRWPGS